MNLKKENMLYMQKHIFHNWVCTDTKTAVMINVYSTSDEMTPVWHSEWQSFGKSHEQKQRIKVQGIFYIFPQGPPSPFPTCKWWPKWFCNFICRENWISRPLWYHSSHELEELTRVLCRYASVPTGEAALQWSLEGQGWGGGLQVGRKRSPRKYCSNTVIKYCY